MISCNPTTHKHCWLFFCILLVQTFTWSSSADQSLSTKQGARKTRISQQIQSVRSDNRVVDNEDLPVMDNPDGSAHSNRLVHYWSFYDPIKWDRSQQSNSRQSWASTENSLDRRNHVKLSEVPRKNNRNTLLVAFTAQPEMTDEDYITSSDVAQHGYYDSDGHWRQGMPREFIFFLPGNQRAYTNVSLSRSYSTRLTGDTRQQARRGQESDQGSWSSSYSQTRDRAHDISRSGNEYYYGRERASQSGRTTEKASGYPPPTTTERPWPTHPPTYPPTTTRRPHPTYTYYPTEPTNKGPPTYPPPPPVYPTTTRAPPTYPPYPTAPPTSKGPPTWPTYPTTTYRTTTYRYPSWPPTTTYRYPSWPPTTTYRYPSWPPTTEQTKGPPTYPPSTQRPPTTNWPPTTPQTKGPPSPVSTTMRPSEKGPPGPRPRVRNDWTRTSPHVPVGPGDVDPRRGDMPPENELLVPPVATVTATSTKAAPAYSTPLPPESPPRTVRSTLEERRRLEAERERMYRVELENRRMSVREEHEVRRREQMLQAVQHDVTTSSSVGTPRATAVLSPSTTSVGSSVRSNAQSSDDYSVSMSRVQHRTSQVDTAAAAASTGDHTRHHASERRRLRMEMRRQRIAELRRRAQQSQDSDDQRIQQEIIRTSSSTRGSRNAVNGDFFLVSPQDVHNLIQRGHLNSSADMSEGSNTRIRDRMERARLIRNLLRNQQRSSTAAPQPLAIAMASSADMNNEILDQRVQPAAAVLAGSQGTGTDALLDNYEYVVEPVDSNDIAAAPAADPEPKVSDQRARPHDPEPREGDLRLVGGRSEKEGNVEIFHLDRWGSVCDDEWDEREAQVVCNHLGFSGTAKPTSNSQYGKTGVRIWMDNLYCVGTERSLSDCRFDGWSIYDCNPSEAAGVVCDADKSTSTTTTTSAPAVRAKEAIKSWSNGKLQVRLANGRIDTEGRVEVRHGSSGNWSLICGDGWGLLQANVVCRQLGFGYAADASQTDFFGGSRANIMLSGVECRGNEASIDDCLHSGFGQVFCPGDRDNIATVNCAAELADLLPDPADILRTLHLEDRQLWYLQCALEENCLGSKAYDIQKTNEAGWHLETRRLLRFTAKIVNQGTAEFRPFLPKQAWQWHQCHLHYHSMEVFAHFDLLDPRSGKKIAEGHKASFCLEDNDCRPGTEPVFNCENFGDQGISVGCADIYAHTVDCQWIDVSEVDPGYYVFKVSINPEFKVGEQTFENNAAVCNLTLTQTYAHVANCHLTRP